MSKNENIERRKRIAKRIKELRLKANYTSHETFATDNGLSRRNYWAIENGNDFKMSTLLKLTKIFDVSLEEFFKDLD
ncbi:helix-turn-helix domain-containing protein [Flagellimonas onchidii]|uniref:helix-turn-helix domain-containing protein n=1 Tax=Flagellimonas onchidii TaxID=2562684 RepID=UPI0010A6AF81|nr:helix-turn-helix transcriptional regulator [Allomuricauda onchidii]